jgi:hypothetical protein
MLEAYACHLQKSAMLFCISDDQHEAAMLVAGILELGGGR